MTRLLTVGHIRFIIPTMTLREFLGRKGLTLTEFGKLIGKTPQSVGRYRDGKKFPRPETLRAIERATGGHVTANDFLPVPSPPAASARAA
jgi:transcriptional regulator with XRE-family HTH domain